MSTSTPARGRSQRLGLRKPGAAASTVAVGLRDSTGTAALPADGHFDVSIVVPTRNEAGNVPELVRRLNGALSSTRAEILFVDDSDDDTPAVILAEAQRSDLPIRLVHRPVGERQGRLGGAVVLGFQRAGAPWALVLDGDLQHPPEAVPALVAATRAPGTDLVYGSRYTAAGDASGLGGRTRALVSASSTRLAKALFPGRLGGISDPMSGFFAVRLAALDLNTLKPPGYKVLLEILAMSRLTGTVGVPFSFQPRFSGDSKASFAEGVRYLQQLLALRLGTSVAALGRLTAFLAVGLSGVGVNTAVLWWLTGGGSGSYVLPALAATNVAVVWNFVLLELFVLKQSRKRSPLQGFVRFWGLNMLLLPVQLGLLALFVEGLSQNPVAANVVVLTIVFVIRYLATTMWVYERSGSRAPAGSAGAGAAADFFAPAATGPVASPAGPLPRVALRFGAAIAASLVAFPAIAVHGWQLLLGRPVQTVLVVIVLCAAGALVAARAVPPPGDPDVHDRQLDFILALPALAAAVFLSFAWPRRFTVDGPTGSREVLAGTVFLAGAMLLLLGTRCTARLRRLLLAPLLLLPVVQDRPALAVALSLLFVALAGKAAFDGWSVGRRSVHLFAGLRGRRGSPPAREPETHGFVTVGTKLPKWRPTLVLVVVLAAVLGFLAVAAPAPVAGGPSPSAGSR